MQPTVTPVEITITPRIGCEFDCDDFFSPTPTSKPPEDRHEDTTDHNRAGTVDPPVCTDEIPKPAVNPQTSVENGQIKVTWSHDGTNISKWTLNYSPNKGDYFYGIQSIDLNARQIHVGGLTWTGHTWFKLGGWNTDNCVSYIEFDP